jgi:acetoin utilization deacetylase AcuC-like enzyme
MPKPARCWWNRALRAMRGRGLELWYHPAYRLPMTSVEARVGIDPRRADLVAWYLVEWKAVPQSALRRPGRISYDTLARVHSRAYLESLDRPENLARIFGVDPWDVPVDELLACMRYACGGTLEAARAVAGHGGVALNLLGGFHHAYPDKGGGLCALNDIAVAIATLRAEGFSEPVAVLDLDAHPPDGLAACLEADPACWIGSISGCDWGPLGDVDETVLPDGSGDEPYMTALDALLARMPAAGLVFVIAGGDVLAGDKLGRLNMTPEGARERDLRVGKALGSAPAVWLPGGGYQRRHGWRALAGTALALELGSRARIPEDMDPMRHHFGLIARSLGAEDLGAPTVEADDGALFTQQDIEEALGMRPRPKERRLLGFYSEEGVEHALSAYGILPHLRRLGYDDFAVSFDRASSGERLQLHGQAEGERFLLLETVVERRSFDGHDMLFVNWLSLRNPRATFTAQRPQLPGQEVPGLGMAREAGQMLARMAKRLDLAGVAFHPAWFHVAYTARYHFRFLQPEIQGHFEALMRDLAALPLLDATHAIADGRVRLHDEPFAWEPGIMAYRFEAPEDFDAEVDRIREAAHFSVVQGSSA